MASIVVLSRSMPVLPGTFLIVTPVRMGVILTGHRQVRRHGISAGLIVRAFPRAREISRIAVDGRAGGHARGEGVGRQQADGQHQRHHRGKYTAPSASVSMPQPKDLVSYCGNFLKIFRKIWSRAAKKPRSAESAMPSQSTGRAGRSPALPVHSPCQFIRHARFSPPSRAGSPCAGGSGTAKTPHFRSRRCG